MSARERQQLKSQAHDLMFLHGDARRPEPPRDVYAQPGSRKSLITWKLPVNSFRVARFRVYLGDESTLFRETPDIATRSADIPLTAGASPPVMNVFVSAVSVDGIESTKVQVQASSTAEAGAPSDPTPPPGYTSEGPGGGDTEPREPRIRGTF
jgi:hypothetical protein